MDGVDSHNYLDHGQSAHESLHDDQRDSSDLSTKKLLPRSEEDAIHNVTTHQSTRCVHLYRRQRWRLLAAAVILALSVVFAALLWSGRHAGPRFRVSHQRLNASADNGLGLVASEILPEQPMPIAFANARGLRSWTVWVPPDQRFPLESHVQAELCDRCEAMAQRLAALERGAAAPHPRHRPYYHVDPRYVEVAAAEARGLLPPPPALAPAPAPARPVCARSLTYVLEAADPGLGPMLMALWMARGLAAREGRAFFIDDRRWAYGRWSDYFAPPAAPPCAPPPDAHRVPCPRHAAHLLVSAATRRRVFGHAFADAFEDPRRAGVARQRPIFALLRTGFEALFRLRLEDDAAVTAAMAAAAGSAGAGIRVGVHVRRGDRHPWEFAHQRSYLPPARYAAAARNVSRDAPAAAARWWLASDDPTVYGSPALRGAARAQEVYRLDGPALAAAGVNFTGGVTAAAFWRMGAALHAAAEEEGNAQSARAEGTISEETMHLRREVGRSYVLDLAVLGQADRVVCAVSSVACRLLAVMMGWEAAVERGAWVSIDGDFDWTGIRW